MIRNNVQQTTNTAGGGTYNLSGTVTSKGVVPFASVCVSGKKYRYKVEMQNGTVFEVNEGTFTAGGPSTLSRDRLIQSSTGSPIAWPDASDKIVSLVAVAEDFGPEGERHRYIIAGGTAAAYTGATDVASTVLVGGMRVHVKIPLTNSGACTYNHNSLGAKAIKKRGVTLDPEPGELPQDFIAELVYEATADVWQVENPCVMGSLGVKVVSAAAYAFLASDVGKLIVFTNAAGCAVTLSQATGAFASPWWTECQNAGAGSVVITPATSTIDGAATLTIAPNSGAEIRSDGANYRTRRDAGGAFSLPVTTKAVTYAMVVADKGTEINFTTAGVTFNLLAAATAGNGGTIGVRNSAASGDVTIDPNGAETLDGLTTRLLRPGNFVLLRSDGINWRTLTGFYSFESAEQTLALSTVFTVAHGLGEQPNCYQAVFRCKTADLNWAVGDEIDYGAVQWTYGGALQADATNMRGSINQTYYPNITNRTSGAGTTLTAANWKLVFRAKCIKG
ncbi:MAG: hypothetical protein IPK59_04100 [Rhodospirillaceae bacterium]|nr:hypothetical protein [Rhodospirillaceae bacterium]